MSRITLIPCETEKYCEWSTGGKYALVGKTSGDIHMIFVSHSYENAKVIRDSYTKIMKDAGYDIMKVKEYQ
jgi:hypothetical protein